VPKQPAGRHRYLAHVQLKGATVVAAGNEVTLVGDSSVAAGASGDKVPRDASFTIGLTAVMRCSLLHRLPYEKAAAGKKAGKAAGEPKGETHRVDPKFVRWPRSLTENPYESFRVDPNSGSTL
jgi:hypothetical protein